MKRSCFENSSYSSAGYYSDSKRRNLNHHHPYNHEIISSSDDDDANNDEINCCLPVGVVLYLDLNFASDLLICQIRDLPSKHKWELLIQPTLYFPVVGVVNCSINYYESSRLVSNWERDGEYFTRRFMDLFTPNNFCTTCSILHPCSCSRFYKIPTFLDLWRRKSLFCHLLRNMEVTHSHMLLKN